MATMVVEVYDALRSIGVAEDKAAKAAEAMATLEPQFAAIRGEMQQGFARVDQEFAAVRSDMRVLKWQVGAIIAVLLLIGAPSVLLLVRVAAKVGALG